MNLLTWFKKQIVRVRRERTRRVLLANGICPEHGPLPILMDSNYGSCTGCVQRARNLQTEKFRESVAKQEARRAELQALWENVNKELGVNG